MCEGYPLVWWDLRLVSQECLPVFVCYPCLFEDVRFFGLSDEVREVEHRLRHILNSVCIHLAVALGLSHDRVWRDKKRDQQGSRDVA